ncbi:MAG: phosphohydrolase [Chelatococcus sp.]|nr:MAG: phosphohydrolase [Chelatococcus sp.]
MDEAQALASAPARRGDWMQTYTGRMFWPLDPRSDEVEIVDIAHALSMQCRYAGHCRRFYSVAEHCVLMAEAVSPEHRLQALMHDAAEAYLVDLPRPVKRQIELYKVYEQRVHVAICARFGLSPEIPTAVHAADNRILRDELEQAMLPPPERWPAQDVEPLGVTLQFWSPNVAEFRFMALFDRLISGRPEGAGVAPISRTERKAHGYG